MKQVLFYSALLALFCVAGSKSYAQGCFSGSECDSIAWNTWTTANINGSCTVNLTYQYRECGTPPQRQVQLQSLNTTGSCADPFRLAVEQILIDARGLFVFPNPGDYDLVVCQPSCWTNIGNTYSPCIDSASCSTTYTLTVNDTGQIHLKNETHNFPFNPCGLMQGCGLNQCDNQNLPIGLVLFAGSSGDECEDRCFWKLLGNNLIAHPDYFLGTKDASPLIMKTNKIERLRITQGNQNKTLIGIQQSTPQGILDVFLHSSDEIYFRNLPIRSAPFFLTTDASGRISRSWNYDQAYLWSTTGNNGISSSGSNFLGPLNPVPLIFKTSPSNSSHLERMRINPNGLIQMGDYTSLTATQWSRDFSQPLKLAVNGGILAKELVVTLDGTYWSDFVFEKNYKLTSLLDLEKEIKEHKHLPDIPSAEEVQEKGVAVAAIEAKLLRKVEEITLYLIDMKKENNALKARIEGLEKKNKKKAKANE
ncbi:MAG: hypothetical protein NT007_15760 [Candidatus Kapabacteria bacterium]|nr:hypothetical protein [Candidatus Kapabacteria bacterium]